MITEKKTGEMFEDYFLRICSNKKKYGLQWPQITQLLNAHADTPKTKDTYRHEWMAFERGMKYAHGESADNILTVLSCSDFHYPFNLPIETFAEHVGKINVLQLNGDLVDMHSISKFSKSFRNSPMDEIIGCRQYLIDLIEYLKPGRVVCNYGNHEQRFSGYLAKNLDTDLLELLPDNALELIFETGFYHYNKADKTRIFYQPLCVLFDNVTYNNDWYSQVGNTIFCHPSTYSSLPMRTAENAVRYFRNTGFAFDCLVMAHTHKVGMYYSGDIVIYEQGTCSDISRIDYMSGRLSDVQKQGYILLRHDYDGNIIQDKTKLIIAR